MSTTQRKARKRAGIPFVKAAKTPTDPIERSHTWKQRWNKAAKRREIKPARVALAHGYGVANLGWQPITVYINRRGQLTSRGRS